MASCLPSPARPSRPILALCLSYSVHQDRSKTGHACLCRCSVRKCAVRSPFATPTTWMWPLCCLLGPRWAWLHERGNVRRERAPWPAAAQKHVHFWTVTEFETEADPQRQPKTEQTNTNIERIFQIWPWPREGEGKRRGRLGCFIYSALAEGESTRSDLSQTSTM